MSLLSVRDLTVKFGMRNEAVTALRRISFDLGKGERLGIVGESGAGKSITGFSLMNLLSRPGLSTAGRSFLTAKMSPKCVKSRCGKFGAIAWP